MRKALILNIIIGVLLFFLIVIINYNGMEVFLSNAQYSHSKVIIIDAGHGGIDGGGIGITGTVEKDINLLISQKLKAYLEDHGYTCIMTREVDEGLYGQYGTIRNKKNEDLKNRKELIKKYRGDIFISIHLNKFTQSQYFGAQVFYLKGDEESHKLAKGIQDELIKTIGRGNKRVEKASNEYYILRGNTIPSIIVECGFLSNSQEERLLKSVEYQNTLAWSIYIGLIKYFNEPVII